MSHSQPPAWGGVRVVAMPFVQVATSASNAGAECQTRVVGHDSDLVRVPASLAQEGQIPMHILGRLPRYGRRKSCDGEGVAPDGRFHIPKKLKVIGCSARQGFDIQMDAVGAGLDETARMICERPALAPVLQVYVAVEKPAGPWDDADFRCDPGSPRETGPRLQDRSGQSLPWTASRASPRDPSARERGRFA